MAFFWPLKTFFQPKGPQNASHVTRSANIRQLHHHNIAQKKEQSTAVTMLKTALVEGFARILNINERVGAVQNFFEMSVQLYNFTNFRGSSKAASVFKMVTAVLCSFFCAMLRRRSCLKLALRVMWQAKCGPFGWKKVFRGQKKAKS